MCGIFGVLSFQEKGSEDIRSIAERSASLMERRGPDDVGVWCTNKLAFSFRRLSIIDVSQAGHQPMVSSCGSYTIVFNGELYNFRELKVQLENKGYRFVSKTDTEVILNALIEWGAGALSKFNGMFALGFWNGKDQTLLIARDHVGMKPLYYSLSKAFFIFGSQLDQVLLPLKRNETTVDQKGLASFLALGYYPSPRTVFNEVKMLEPGRWLTISKNSGISHGVHFDLGSFYRSNMNNVIGNGELKEEISAAVKRHLISDVPIGTFLSGGLDSGIITALTRDSLGDDFTAFTLSNPGTKFDEAGRATAAARYLRIPHRIVETVNVEEAVMKFQEAYQEPFGDFSAIPAMMVTAEAKKSVKVMLSGDGSDEFFFGYNRMTSMLRSSEYYRYPLTVRRILKRAFPKKEAITFKDFNSMLFYRQSYGDPKVISELSVDMDEVVDEFVKPFGDYDGCPSDLRIKLNTIYRYFQLQLLKLDRASMYNSIEARVPFADKDLMRYTIAFTAKQATQENFNDRKVPLRKIYEDLYPKMEKQAGRKLGFTIDMESLLKSKLKDAFLSSLESPSLFDPFIDFKAIRRRILQGEELGTFSKWFLFSLQTWSKTHY